MQYINNTTNHTLDTIPPPLPKYNVILADYLIGAMDGFVPYQQDLIIPQLMALLAPKGRLYIVGLQPIPDSVPLLVMENNSTTTTTTTKTDNDIDRYQHSVRNLICRVRQIRDACILLAGHRCYREYPMEWILRQVELYNNSHNTARRMTTGNKETTTDPVRLVHSRQFPILYRHAAIMKQINVGRSKIPYLPAHLRESMQQVWKDLENESKQYTSEIPGGRVQFGFDYVIAIEKNNIPVNDEID